jgi:hypothetical protein
LAFTSAGLAFTSTALSGPFKPSIVRGLGSPPLVASLASSTTLVVFQVSCFSVHSNV